MERCCGRRRTRPSGSWSCAAHRHGIGTSRSFWPLGDALRGDQSLFAREDSIEAQWRIVEDVLDGATPVHQYEPGTWGPQAAESLMTGEGGWLDPAAAGVTA